MSERERERERERKRDRERVEELEPDSPTRIVLVSMLYALYFSFRY